MHINRDVNGVTFQCDEFVTSAAAAVCHWCILLYCRFNAIALNLNLLIKDGQSFGIVTLQEACLGRYRVSSMFSEMPSKQDKRCTSPDL